MSPQLAAARRRDLACGAYTGGSDGMATSVGAGKPILNPTAAVSPLPRYVPDIELAVRDGDLLAITWGSGNWPYVPVEIERLTGKRVCAATFRSPGVVAAPHTCRDRVRWGATPAGPAGRFAAQTPGVVAAGDQQLGAGVGPAASTAQPQPPRLLGMPRSPAPRPRDARPDLGRPSGTTSNIKSNLRMTAHSCI